MDSETALLSAVASQLQTVLGYTVQQCNVEFDEVPPAAVGDFYIAVMPGGWEPGPRNNTCGGILDEIVSIDVAVIQRAPRVPRDRSRTLLLDNLNGINIRHREILNAFGQFSYAVMNAANALLTANGSGHVEGFILPLRFGGLERRPRAVPSEYFKAQAGEAVAGLVRTARYVGARRIQHIAGGVT